MNPDFLFSGDSGITKFQVLEAASGLLSGSDRESTDPEYVRALSEMTCDLLGISMDAKDAVGEILWAVAP